MIQRFFVFVMLLVFTLSITPKNVLHKLLANHKDVFSYHHTKEATISQSQFACDTDDLVVSFPFVETGYSSFLLTQTRHKQPVICSYWLYSAQSFEANDLRGPPATV
jgi:hypothetical protein